MKHVFVQFLLDVCAQHRVSYSPLREIYLTESLNYIMAVRRVILSSASPSQNFASSLLDFANDDSLSIGEINRSRKRTESTIKPLGLSWTGDFESLKYFVAESLKLAGTWSQPEGD